MTANKQATLTKRGPAPRALGPLIAEVRSLIQAARHAAASTVNTLQVRTNFEIGRRIVEHEQKGTNRAEYGAQLLGDLSTRLMAGLCDQCLPASTGATICARSQ